MKNRNNIYIALYVFIFMLFSVIASPLINHPGADSAVFFAMGRGMAAGKIIYKELFDHKGLYTYFINFIAALINNHSVIGVFILECIFMFIGAKFVHSSFLLYADEKISWLGTQIFIFFALSRLTLEGGNLTEEYALTFQLISVYLWLKYIKDKQAKASYMFIHGINAGVAFFLRPNMIMMWGAIAILVGYDLLTEKKFADFWKNLLAGLLGLSLAALPVIIYVVKTDSVSEAIFAMFTYNMMYVDSGQSLISKILETVFNFKQIILMLAILFSSIIILRNKQGKYYFLPLAMSIVCVSLSGRRYGHYYLYLVPFVLPLAYELASWICKRMNYKYAVIIILLVSSLFCWRPKTIIKSILGLSPNAEQHANYIKYNSKYYSEDEKVLVTGFSAGVYNILGVIPHEKYFYIPATEYKNFPDAADAQIESIISGVNDVIITKPNIFTEAGRTEEVNEVLEKNYDLLYHDEKNDIYMYGRKNFVKP